MIVLQAGVCDGQLFLWGEAPAGGRAAPRRGRKPRGSKPSTAPASPYDPGHGQLSAALTEAASDRAIDADECERLTAWMPTTADRPLPSSPLVGDPPESGTATTLAPWTISVVPLAVAQAVDFLCQCMGKDTLAPGVIVGKTLDFWAMALRFAGALVARQQFLPGVEVNGEAARARWEPVLAGADAGRLAALARAMPHACRALGRSADATPDTPAATVLARFLSEVVDHLVRASGQTAGTVAPAGRRTRPRRPSFDSLHDQWLHALRTPDGALSAGRAELTQLANTVREWRRPIEVAATAPFRLCFRLEEPDGDEVPRDRPPRTAWRVSYLLQAVDDPSLLLPAEEAWNGRGRRAAVLRRSSFNPQEFLLSTLGQASAIDPRIEQSLKTAAPGGYEVDATGAHDFLTARAWLLEQAGFGVLLPAWWTRKGTKLHLSLRANVTSPKMQGGGGLSLEQIVRFDWQVALGDQTLTLEELQTLARLKEPLVRVRGQWVQLSAEEIQAAIAFWKNRGQGQATVREVLRMALGTTTAVQGIALEGVAATGWVGDLLARLEGRASFEELPTAGDFHGRLRPYQVRGYSWLAFLREWGLGACLADDMGLGKTVQTLALVQRDWHADGKRPVLLICPMSVVGNWHKEAARFTPDLPVLVHHGLTRAKGAAFKKEARRHALVLSSYALLHRDFEILKGVDWAGVILDEAQNIKNPETKQAKAARALPADYRIALTGTPVENHVGDLWSIMEFLNPGLLGTRTEFRRTFFIPIQAQRDPEAGKRLQRLTGPFVLRRLKTDKSVIADLPEKMEMKVFCPLTREQASLYEAVVEDAGKSLDETTGIQRKGVVLATLSKLKQVCNHPAQFLGDNSSIPGRSGKLARLSEMLEEVLAAGDRALVFTQFAEMGELLRRHLQETFGREVLFLHGGTTKKQRDTLVSRFQDRDGPALFVLSLKAGGTGLNLTAANHVFHFDRWWNPAVENQATDRAFRIGQTRNVQVHKFLCVGTLEERIDEMIERKQEVAARIVGSGEGWLTELSTAELKDLMALRQEALGE